MRTPTTLVIGLAVLLCPFLAWSGGLDDESGVRDNYTLNASGQILITTQPANDAAGLVRREADGTDSIIVIDGDALGGGVLDGIGSQPRMNMNGVVAFQAVVGGDSNLSGIFTGVPGSITTVAVPGDSIAGESICNAEPNPIINSVNQVFWGTTVEGGDGVEDTCGTDGSGTFGRKVIYRFTPGGGNALLLLADIQGDGADTITASAPFGTDTYTITDAHLIAHGGDAVSSSGNALVTAWLDEDTSSGSSKPRKALLYVTPTTIDLVALDDGNGGALGDDSPFGELAKGVANASGLVFFKANTGTSDSGPVSLSLWTSAGGLSELVATGDAVPLGSGDFNGFSPHMDLNNNGGAAFMAGLDINACGPEGGFGTACQGVYYSPDGSTLIEVARTTAARSEEGVGTDRQDIGDPLEPVFRFERIGSVAILSEDGTVFFQAENDDPDPECGSPGGLDEFGGGGQVTGIFLSRQGGSVIKVIAEGDRLPEGHTVMRLFTPLPELRQHVAQNDHFVIRAWLDTNMDCVSDIEEVILLPPDQPVIPTLGPWGMWLLIGVLAFMGGGVLLRRQHA